MKALSLNLYWLALLIPSVTTAREALSPLDARVGEWRAGRE